MLAVHCAVGKLAGRKLRKINSGIRQIKEYFRVIGKIFLIGVVLHQEDIRQDTVIIRRCRCCDLGFDIIGLNLDDVELEIRMIFLIELLRFLHRIDIELRIPRPYSQGVCIGACTGDFSRFPRSCFRRCRSLGGCLCRGG